MVDSATPRAADPAGSATLGDPAPRRVIAVACSGGRDSTALLHATASAARSFGARVVALHMIGADAPEIVQSLAVAVTAGATKADFDRTLAVHPTTAEEFVLLRTPSRHIGVSSPPVQRAMSAAPD